ncbi:MAG: hypothetical protein KIT58_12025 [Planctomycetota bacterium]|nr:hypothetical protein [Planctomycetota bacterium]
MRRASRLVGCGLALMMGGCTFMEDRVLDFVDIFGLKFVAGKGMKFGIELGNSYMATEYEDFFFSPLPMITGLRRHLLPPNFIFGYYDFEKYGFQSRAAGIWRDKGVDLLGPIDRKLRVVAGNDYLFESVDEFNEWYRRAPERANTVPLDYRQPRYHYITDIHISMAFIIGFELDFSPWQLVDFFLGWFHIDIVKDDQWNRTFDEFEDVQPAPDEFRRPDTKPETTGI